MEIEQRVGVQPTLEQRMRELKQREAQLAIAAAEKRCHQLQEQLRASQVESEKLKLEISELKLINLKERKQATVYRLKLSSADEQALLAKANQQLLYQRLLTAEERVEELEASLNESQTALADRSGRVASLEVRLLPQSLPPLNAPEPPVGPG